VLNTTQFKPIYCMLAASGRRSIKTANMHQHASLTRTTPSLFPVMMTLLESHSFIWRTNTSTFLIYHAHNSFVCFYRHSSAIKCQFYTMLFIYVITLKIIPHKIYLKVATTQLFNSAITTSKWGNCLHSFLYYHKSWTLIPQMLSVGGKMTGRWQQVSSIIVRQTEFNLSPLAN